MDVMDSYKENDEQEGITVAIRMRPLNKNEGEKQRVWKVLPKYNSITQTTSTGKPLSERVTGRTFFAFDKVFEEDISTNQVYDDVAKGIVSSVVNGLNGTIFAYGQTSSGKTYTMQGSGTIQDGASSTGGIVHMAARDIFSNILSQPNRMFLVRASFLEIYNEEVRDLLSNSSSTLPIREDPRRGVFVQSQEEMVTDFSSLLRLLFQGEKSRQVASTCMNERSSRSHTIFRITIESRENEDKEDGIDVECSDASTDGAVRISTLNLVDLAGSESVRHTGATGDRQKEGGMINQSLLTLSRVIVALGQPNPMHINFRDSKLTRILQPSLSGNARMAIICCATPSELYLEETRSTLQFASRAKLVKTNAQVNEVLDDRSIIRRLQRELAEARGQKTGPGTEHLRALENRAANAGTEAMEAKKKLDRLKRSILNDASLFGGNNAVSHYDPSIASRNKPFHNLRPRKRRKSDGVIPSGSTPLKTSSIGAESPKTAPRMKKEKTSHPHLSPRSELSILRQALANRGKLSRVLTQTLEKNTTLLNLKEDECKGLESAHHGLSEENERARDELFLVRGTLQSVQENLDATIGEYEAIIAEKETLILDAFQKDEVEKNKVNVLEQTNEKLHEQLQDLQQKFDDLQQERVRSAFELAQSAEEKEFLQVERQQDKLILAEMNQKIGLVTSQANDADKKYNASKETIAKLEEQVSEANEDKVAYKAQITELVATITEMKSTFEQERWGFDAALNELESQLGTNISEKNNALMCLSELEEQQQHAGTVFSASQESLHQVITESEAERVKLRSKIAELECKVDSTAAEKEDVIARASALGEDLRSNHKSLADAHSTIAEMEKSIIYEREQNSKILAELHEQLESASVGEIAAKEQAELLSAEVQRLRYDMSELQVNHDKIYRAEEERRSQSESIISELREAVEVISEEKANALAQCNLIEEKSISVTQNLESAQRRTEDLISSIAEHQGRCELMEQELQSTQARQEELLEHFEALQLEHTHLQEELENLVRENAELETFICNAQEESGGKVMVLQQEKEAIVREKSELEGMLAEKDESMLSLQTSYTSLRTQATTKEIEKSELLNQIGFLSGKLETMRSECISLETTVDLSRKTGASLCQELTSLKEHHELLTNRHGSQTDEINEVQERLSFLLKEKADIERLLASTEEESRAYRLQNTALEGGLSELRKTLRSSEDSAENANEERNRLEADLTQLERTIEAMRLEICGLHEELGRRDAERIEMESRVMSLEAEKMAALAENDSFQVNQHEQILAWEERIAENEDHLATLSREKGEFAQKCDAYDANNRQLQAQVDMLRATQEASFNKECELQNRLQVLMSDLEGTQSHITTLEADNSNLLKQRQDLEKCSRAHSQSFESDLCNIKASYEEAARQLQTCQMELESLHSSRENALKTLHDREQERDEAVAAMEELSKKHQELSRNLGNALSGEKRLVLEKEIIDLRQSCMELKQLLTSTSGSEGRLREKLAAAENEVILKTRSLEDSQYRLAQLEEDLRQSEVAFEEHLAHDASIRLSQQEPQELLGEIESLKSILDHEREDRKTSEDVLKKQMGEEQRLLIHEGEKMMAEMRNKILVLEQRLSESEHEAYTSRQKIDELHDENQSRVRACKELQATIAETKSSLFHREEQMSSLQAELVEAKAYSYSLKENAVELKEKIKAEAAILEKLERENRTASSEVALLKRQISSTEKTKVELQSECERLTAKIKSTNNVNMQSTEAVGKIRNLEITLLKREETIKQLKLAMEILRQESKSSNMNEELEQLKTKIQEKDQRIKKLQQFKLTKEFAEEHKQLKKDNKRLREEVLLLQSEMRSKESDSALRTEVSELRFDKEALEKKLRKFAAHCQRLEDDKVGLIDALRSCNINLSSYDEINDAVVSLCDQLASMQESGSVASRCANDSTQGREKDSQALQMKLDRIAASEERLSEQVLRYRSENDELRKKLKALSENSDLDSVASEAGRKLRYLEQENLQLMYDVKATKKQLQAAREEIEVLRMNALENSTLDFGTIDVGSNASSKASKVSINQDSSRKTAALSDKTNSVSNVANSKKRSAVNPPNGENHEKSRLRSSAPGLGDAATQGDETAECRQS